jgi:tetratricopeptide (TPR) repeat protein
MGLRTTFLLYICLPALVFAQNREIDSLQRLLDKTSGTAQRVGHLLSIANAYKKQEDRTCFSYCRKALLLTKQIPADTLYFKVLADFGKCYNYLREPDSSILFYKKSLRAIPGLPSQSLQRQKASIYRVVGYIYDGKQQFDSSIHYYNQSMEAYMAIQDTSGYLRSAKEKGDVYSYDGKLDKGLKCYLEALSLAERFTRKKYLMLLLRDIGWNYKDLKNEQMARLYLHKSLREALNNNSRYDIYFSYSYLSTLYSEMLQPDSLNKYVNLQGNYTDAVADDAGTLHLYYINKAFNEYYKKDYAASEKSRLQALELVKKSSLVYDRATSYYNLGEINYTMGKYDRAMAYNDSAATWSAQYPNIDAKVNILKLYLRLYMKKGDYKTALEYAEQYTTLNDSLLTKDMNRKISQMQAQYDVESRDLKIGLLNKEKELGEKENQKNKQRLWFFSAIAVLFVGLSIVAYLAYRRKQKDNVLLRQQRQEILDKTEQLNRQATEIARHQSQMNPHFIFNALISIQKFILKENKQSAVGYLSNLSKLMRLTLYNSEKELISLQEELRFLAFYTDFELQRFGNSFTFEMNVAEELDEEETMIPPMILQPFIENAIRHGIPEKENGRIEVKVAPVMHYGKTALKVDIHDNGIGREASRKNAEKFNAEHVSMAMNITRSRIENYAGKYGLEKAGLLTIADLYDMDNKAAGTTVTVILPYI